MANKPRGAEPVTEQITVPVTRTQLAAIRRAAAEDDRAVATWCRRALAEAAKCSHPTG